MDKSLTSYGFSAQTIAKVKPIVDNLTLKNLSNAELVICRLALDVCSQLEEGTLTPKQADDFFSLLDLYVEDNFPDMQFSKDVRRIIFEGLILHDYGSESGANLNVMKSLASKRLDGLEKK